MININALHSPINILKGKLAILSDSALSPNIIQNIIGIISQSNKEHVKKAHTKTSKKCHTNTFDLINSLILFGTFNAFSINKC